MTSLDQRIAALEEFAKATPSVTQFRETLKVVLNELSYRNRLDVEPAKTFLRVKDLLRETAQTEIRLCIDHDRALWIGDYEEQDRWDYIDAIAAQVRVNKNLAHDAPVHLTYGEDDWNQAKHPVMAARKKFLNEKRAAVSTQFLFENLAATANARVEVYSHLRFAGEYLDSLAELIRTPYSASFTSGSQQMQELALAQISNLHEYIITFPEHLEKLLQVYPRAFQIDVTPSSRVVAVK